MDAELPVAFCSGATPTRVRRCGIGESNSRQIPSFVSTETRMSRACAKRQLPCSEKLILEIKAVRNPSSDRMLTGRQGSSSAGQAALLRPSPLPECGHARRMRRRATLPTPPRPATLTTRHADSALTG
jgi:hypothetical protein